MRALVLSCLMLSSLACGTSTSTAIGSGTLASDAVVTDKVHIDVAVAPSTAQMNPGDTLQLQATVTNADDTSVTWSVDTGTIDANGVYTAPSEAGVYTVTATSNERSSATGTASITVGTPTTSTSSGPSQLPATCYRTGESVVDGTVTVTQYNGLQNGYNGTHEIIIGTLTVTYASDSSVLQNVAVEFALNVASAKDGSGLPQEIPLNPGDTFTTQGVYIPPALANSQYAIMHFTHAPCGYVIINGQQYQ